MTNLFGEEDDKPQRGGGGSGGGGGGGGRGKGRMTNLFGEEDDKPQRGGGGSGGGGGGGGRGKGRMTNLFGEEDDKPQRGGGGNRGGGAGAVRGNESNAEEDAPLVAMHPIHDFKINDLDFADMFGERESLMNRMQKSKCHACPKLPDQWSNIERETRLRQDIGRLKHLISNDNLHLMPEFQKRVAILKELRYIDDNNTVLLKGRVARELNTVRDELIATELIFENALTDLAPEEIVAMLACLIFEIKTESVPHFTDTLAAARERINNTTNRLLHVQNEFGLDLNPRDYKRNVNFGLTEVVYEWSRGMPFEDICYLTDVAEGSIVRTIVRLDETCKEMRNAARIIGNSVLYSKMEQASQLIKRDIVFAASLYYD
eukprot:TRINITY_DN3220_c0_g1_i1.p1 TRINITY_DN3220_c0_g1~~TRINITY_DN3220_c0_g1_i1.p1  ORF type:complete len:374 (-),score=102.40 TRINITY_DN3220_c0_g1_i1:25-1146(-)